MSVVSRKHRSRVLGALLAVAVSAPLHGEAKEAPVAGRDDASAELRICASENEVPYSYKDGSGFENRIAALVAEEMHRKPVFVWTKRPAIYLVRDYLDKKECDVVVGLDTGDERVLTTRPYYRSGYVFVSRADRGIDIEQWRDPALAGMSHVAVGLGSSAEAMLKKLGKYEDNAAYVYSLVDFKSPRNQYVRVDPSRLVKEVAEGVADVAIAFGPEVARYVKASSVPLRMQAVPEDDIREGQTIEFRFQQSMGVRKGDRALLDGLNTALEKAAPKIRGILEQEGIPLLPLAQS